jgi:hypothetical protein
MLFVACSFLCFTRSLRPFRLPVMDLKNLVMAPELKREIPFLTDWLLFRLRKSRAIPFVKLGHRTFLYNAAKVRAALEKREVKEIS